MRKKIGIIGGLSPESTVTYYLHITRGVTARFGDYSYPEISIESVNLENYHRWRNENRWDCIIADLTAAARRLRASGAEFGLIATNTMHKVFDEVQAGVDLPLLHIIDVTAAAVRASGLQQVGLLGTRFTMGDGFYVDGLAARGVRALVPDAADQAVVHRVIEDELVRGELRDESRRRYLEVIDRLAARGAQGVILGCTEIPLLVRPQDCALPLFDTAVLHAQAALELALGAE